MDKRIELMLLHLKQFTNSKYFGLKTSQLTGHSVWRFASNQFPDGPLAPSVNYSIDYTL